MSYRSLTGSGLYGASTRCVMAACPRKGQQAAFMSWRSCSMSAVPEQNAMRGWTGKIMRTCGNGSSIDGRGDRRSGVRLAVLARLAARTIYLVRVDGFAGGAAIKMLTSIPGTPARLCELSRPARRPGPAIVLAIVRRSPGRELGHQDRARLRGIRADRLLQRRSDHIPLHRHPAPVRLEEPPRRDTPGQLAVRA